MNKKICFRFQLDIETTVKVEDVYASDYGAARYLKQLVNEFANDPEALRSIIVIKFYDSYFRDFLQELESILGKKEDEDATILRVARKCTPETFHYFSDLLADAPGNDTGLDEREQERVFGELIDRLCNLTIVHAVFSELPREKSNPSPGMNCRAMNNNPGSCDRGAVSTDTGIVSTDTGAVSTDTGVVSTDTGVVSTDTGVVSTDTGVVSTVRGVVSTDRGVVSTDTGVVSADTGTVSNNICFAFQKKIRFKEVQ